jgi:phosphatidylserine/phosphatidylglycerophosphate/cardiolipin synthase-like enzyme
MKKYLFILLLLIGCGDTNRVGSNSTNSIIPLFSFTGSNYNDQNGMEQLIISDIKSAKKSIKLAIYGFTNDNLRDTLIQAHNNGIDVKIATDDSKFDSEDITVIKNAGIPVISDEKSSALMHHKFLVIDSSIVWTGSANYTYYSFYKNNENIVKIVDANVAYAYTQEFYELVNHQDKKGAYISEKIEVYFSPEDDFEQRLLELVEGAKESIQFLAFAFTNKNLSDALIQKYQEGVSISGVFDKKQDSGFLKRYSKYTTLLQNGLNVKLDGNRQTMHNKVFIIDSKTVVTGSYNFTIKANNENNENILVIHNKEFANRYIKEFNEIYDLAN